MKGRRKLHTEKYEEIMNDWNYNSSYRLTNSSISDHMFFVPWSLQFWNAASAFHVLQYVGSSISFILLFICFAHLQIETEVSVLTATVGM